MNRLLRPFRRTFAALAIGLGFLLLLVACQGGPLVATPTAIPLSATATPSPRPVGQSIQPPTIATRPSPTSAPVPQTAVAPATGPSVLGPQLDDRLAQATVLDFLMRLASGKASSAFDLYLTGQARAGAAGQLLPLFAAPERALQGATLVEILRTSDTSYQARAELRWAGDVGGGPVTQAMSLQLAYQRGLWLIDGITLAEP